MRHIQASYHNKRFVLAPTAVMVLLAACTTPIPLSPAEPRIVALSPSLAKTLERLGVVENVVGVDCESAALLGLSRAACLTHTDIDAVASILAMQPTLILVEQDSGYDDIARELRARGVELLVAAPHSTLDIFDVFRRLAVATGRPAAGDGLVRDVMYELAQISAAVLHRKRPSVALVLGHDPITVLPGDSYATDLVEIPGGNTVLEDIVGPVLTLTAAELGTRAPDVIIDASRECWDQQSRIAARAFWRQSGLASRIEFLPQSATRQWGELPVSARTIQALLFPDLAISNPDEDTHNRIKDSDRGTRRLFSSHNRVGITVPDCLSTAGQRRPEYDRFGPAAATVAIAGPYVSANQALMPNPTLRPIAVSAYT